MKLNFEAAKAYVGGAVAGLSTAGVTKWIIGLVEAAAGFDIPVSFEDTVIVPIASFVVGYIAVYFTSNQKPSST